MKTILTILSFFTSNFSFAHKSQHASMIENYWKHFTYHHQKIVPPKQILGYLPPKDGVFIYGAEASILQQKLLMHQIQVPQLLESENSSDDITQYLKWIIFAKEDPKKIFPDIIRRPLGFTPNFITESFYRFGISLPLN